MAKASTVRLARELLSASEFKAWKAMSPKLSASELKRGKRPGKRKAKGGSRQRPGKSRYAAPKKKAASKTSKAALSRSIRDHLWQYDVSKADADKMAKGALLYIEAKDLSVEKAVERTINDWANAGRAAAKKFQKKASPSKGQFTKSTTDVGLKHRLAHFKQYEADWTFTAAEKKKIKALLKDGVAVDVALHKVSKIKASPGEPSYIKYKKGATTKVVSAPEKANSSWRAAYEEAQSMGANKTYAIQIANRVIKGGHYHDQIRRGVSKNKAAATAAENMVHEDGEAHEGDGFRPVLVGGKRPKRNPAPKGFKVPPYSKWPRSGGRFLRELDLPGFTFYVEDASETEGGIPGQPGQLMVIRKNAKGQYVGSDNYVMRNGEIHVPANDPGWKQFEREVPLTSTDEIPFRARAYLAKRKRRRGRGKVNRTRGQELDAVATWELMKGGRLTTEEKRGMLSYFRGTRENTSSAVQGAFHYWDVDE